MDDDPKVWEGEERRQVSQWHVGREIPIAVLFMLMLQTGGGVWWLAQMSSKIDRAVDTLAEFKAERYTKEDARRDRELLLSLIAASDRRQTEYDRRMAQLETHLNGRLTTTK